MKQDQVAIMRIECSGLICLEEFKIMPQLGRFTLRDESKYFRARIKFSILININAARFISDKTIAIGKVLKVIE